MEGTDMFSIVMLILGAVVGAFLTYLVQKALQRQSQEHEERLQINTAILQTNLKEIAEFIKKDGLIELLRFFEDPLSPRKLLDQLNNLSTMDQHFGKMSKDFQELRSELESMRGMLSERLFNRVTARIHDGIELNRTFTSRLKEKSESKQFLESHWLDIEMIQHVLASADSIFIESGSTLAYCMLSIMDNIEKYRISKKPLRVCTNNVAIYMMLLFQEHFEPVLLPGKPDNQYAATYGDIKEDGSHGDFIKDFLEKEKVSVLFTTSSFVDIDYGPHVSSVQNHAMKRILNEYASAPNQNRMNILVIVAEKITSDVDEKKIPEKCLLIFDPERTKNVHLNQAVLEKTRVAWEEHLHKPHNYIITGTSEGSQCPATVDRLAIDHNMQSYKLQVEGGMLFKIPSI